MMKAEPDSSNSLVFECDFEEPPEKVWRALTEPALLEAWLTTDALPVTDSSADSSADSGADSGADSSADSGADSGADANADSSADYGIGSGKSGAGRVPRQARPAPHTVHRADRTDRTDRTYRAARQPGASECELLTREPYRFLRYRWRDRESGVGEAGRREVHSVITVELTPCPTGGTHLRLTHGEFRLVSVAPVVTAARIVPLMSARRRTPTVSFAARACLRRAA